MPPAKTFLRRRIFTALVDLEATEIEEAEKRPIKSLAKKHNFLGKFMDLDEFLSHPSMQDGSLNVVTDDDDERSRPNVDLLQSLITLGKLINDLKQNRGRNSSENSEDEKNEPSHPIENEFERGLSRVVGNEELEEIQMYMREINESPQRSWFDFISGG